MCQGATSAKCGHRLAIVNGYDSTAIDRFSANPNCLQTGCSTNEDGQSQVHARCANCQSIARRLDVSASAEDELRIAGSPRNRGHTDAMTSNDVCERLGVLEKLVQHLDEKTGCRCLICRRSPDPSIGPRAAAPRLRRQTMGAIKAYRAEANVDLPTASRFIESL